MIDWSLTCDFILKYLFEVTAHKVLILQMFWKFVESKMIFNLWMGSSFLSIFSILFKVLIIIHSNKYKNFLLYNIIWYMFELFTLALISVLDFVNIQVFIHKKQWKWEILTHGLCTVGYKKWKKMHRKINKLDRNWKRKKNSTHILFWQKK